MFSLTGAGGHGAEMEPLLVALLSQRGRRRAVGSRPGNPGDAQGPGAPTSTSGLCLRHARPDPSPYAAATQRKPLGHWTKSPAVPLDGRQLPLKG